MRKIKIQYQDATIHYPALDGLRGVAILMVLLYHLFGFSAGWMGVDLFFVLSGFLITSVLLDTSTQNGFMSRFYYRRALRILPLYYTVLVIYFLWYFMTEGWGRWPDAVLYIFYLQNWVFSMENHLPLKVFSDLKHLWSLAIEEQFYIVYPILFLWIPAARMKQWLIALIIMALLLRMGLWYNQVVLAAYVWTPARMDALAIGGLLSVLLRTYKRISVVVPLLITVLMAGQCLVSVDLYHSWYRTIGYTVNAAFFAVVLLLALSDFPWVRTCFSLPILRHIGKLSYGLYIYHYIIWMASDRMVDHPSAYHHWVVLVITYLVSLASFHFLETPFLRRKK